MAKRKRQSTRPQSSYVPAGGVARLTVDQAFQELLNRFGKPQKASGRLDRAFREGDATLCGRYANGEWFPVSQDWFAQHLIIKAREAPDGWHAEVDFTKGVDRFAETEWAVSANEIEALYEDEDVPSTRRGRKTQFDWDVIQTEFYGRLYYERVSPDADINVEDCADKLMVWCAEHFGEEHAPQSTATREKISEWTTIWRRRPKQRK
jgi:hypothetical protein